MAQQTSNFYSIGKLVKKLKPEFRDISISKVRYLENEGLIKPFRTESGYRQFTDSHLERLKLILRLQKDYFLPLSEIKKKTDALDRGEKIEGLQSKDQQNDILLKNKESKISLDDAAMKTSLSKKDLDKLNEYHLLNLNGEGNTKTIDMLDLEVIEIAKAFSEFGIEPRHLSMFENLAEREALLYYQITAPTAKRNIKKAEKQINDLLKLSQQLKSILLKKAILKQFK